MNMYVSIRATLGEQHDVFKVPQAALQRDATGAFVLVIGSDGKVAQKRISADSMRGDSWIITDGIADGDQVIVSGIQKAKPGSPAKGTPWQANAQADTKPVAPASVKH